jgi:hypothetical protein
LWPNWNFPPVPDYWNWVGLVATCLGALLSAGGFIAAWVSAVRAGRAQESADQAWRGATRLGRVAQLADINADLQELQRMIVSKSAAPAFRAKCDRLRARVSRFKYESHADLLPSEQEDLDLARTHFEQMGASSADPETGKLDYVHIQIGMGNAGEALGPCPKNCGSSGNCVPTVIQEWSGTGFIQLTRT